mmetsp:Transcript_26368/g.81038  ORF Transcript_26368/g.81038 Transcript_26368/m.81038 type:complete len:203 (-) Transcript_26368:8-616(-)
MVEHLGLRHGVGRGLAAAEGQPVVRVDHAGASDGDVLGLLACVRPAVHDVDGLGHLACVRPAVHDVEGPHVVRHAGAPALQLGAVLLHRRHGRTPAGAVGVEVALAPLPLGLPPLRPRALRRRVRRLMRRAHQGQALFAFVRHATLAWPSATPAEMQQRGRLTVSLTGRSIGAEATRCPRLLLEAGTGCGVRPALHASSPRA